MNTGRFNNFYVYEAPRADIVTCWVCHATNKFTLSECSESLLRFACTLMHFTIVTCDGDLQNHLASGPILWCVDYDCLQRRSFQD
jgi:hypothetical protein